MPKLGDVIGAMLSDVARARVHADLEAIRIAEVYSRDPMLKHLSVPRFRLPEIVVELPVLIAGTDARAEAGEGWSVGEPTGREIRQAVRDGLVESEFSLTRAEIAKVSGAAVERSKQLFASESRSLLSPGRVSGDLASAAVGAVKEIERDISAEQLQALERATTASMSAILATKLAPAPSLDVLVTAEEIKAHADGASVVRLRLTIAEDAYELVSRDDGQGYSLIPE